MHSCKWKIGAFLFVMRSSKLSDLIVLIVTTLVMLLVAPKAVVTIKVKQFYFCFILAVVITAIKIK